MRGFNTKKAQSCKDGGLIRGPGTGTSDSIPRGFKPGTFIMPADSTKAIGPDVLESIAKVPTKVSNGEFAHTPKQVHAVGINALRMMKDATHSPKDAGVYFANGGAVQGRGAKGFAIGGEVTNDVTRIGNSYSGGNVGGFQTPVQRLAGGGAVEDQALAALRRARDAQPVGSPNIAAIDQSIAQRNQSIGGARSALSAIAAPFQKPLPAVPANPTDMRLAAGSQTTPMEAQAPEALTDVQSGGGNVAAVEAPTTQPSAQPAPAQPVAQALAQVPMLGAVEAKGFQAPSVRHSGNNWKSENDLRNLRVSASSIMNNGGRWDQHGKGVVSPERAAYMQALQTDAALQGDEVKGNQQAMAQGQSNARAAMQQTGENQRTSLREQGFATRDQRKAGMDERTLTMQEAESGFKTRAQAQLESLRNTLLDPNATTEQKAQAQAQISALNGGQKAKDNIVTLGGGQEWDQAAGAMRNVPQRAIDLRTGQEIGGKGPTVQIDKNSQALAIKDNPSLTREQKVDALRKLGYS